jgi:flagellar biosynthetic protein FlhB
MAGDQTESNPTEPATPHKLEKAREKGSIAKSAELVFGVVLAVSVACVYGLGGKVMLGTAALFQPALSATGHVDLSQPAALNYMGFMAARAAAVFLPVIFSIWVSAVFCAALQARGVFSTHPLKPDFSRVNPAVGLKRVLSLRALLELARSLAKLLTIGMTMTLWCHYRLGAILGLAARTPRAMADAGLALFGEALTLLTVLVLLFALLEWRINRWEYLKRMRMSKREVKDEHKEREGDPRIKKRLRELRLEWFKRTRQLTKVRTADVLLTNPTHYAVALEYRHGEMPAPMITARGQGEVARRMRAEARRRAVPVIENPPLARALFALRESDVYVPPQHFHEVARVLRWVFAARGPRADAKVPA